MADDYAEISKRMHRFSIHEFDKGKSTWDAYIFQFEQTCRVKGLTGEGPNATNARRDLLLAYVGSEHLDAIRNYFYPDDINTKSFTAVKEAFQTLYRPALTIFAARMEFGAAVRLDGESFTQFANRLRNLSRSCDYGNSLDEQLRDRLAAGARHSKLQLELRQQWPDGKKDPTTKVSFQDVFDLALTMERAENEVQSGEVALAVQKPNRWESTNGLQKRYQGQRAHGRDSRMDECSRCGRGAHQKGEKCPAKEADCRKCGKTGHFQAKCLQRNKHSRKSVRRVEDDENLDQDVRDSLENVRSVKDPSRATIQVNINGQPIEMEFDTGASQSIISEQLWTELGNPKLSVASPLTAYGGLCPILLILGCVYSNLAVSLASPCFVSDSLSLRPIGIDPVARLVYSLLL